MSEYDITMTPILRNRRYREIYPRLNNWEQSIGFKLANWPSAKWRLDNKRACGLIIIINSYNALLTWIIWIQNATAYGVNGANSARLWRKSQRGKNKISFLREQLLLARYYSEIRLFQPRRVNNSKQFPLSSFFVYLFHPSLTISPAPSTSSRSRPLRRGSISTMIVIHVRYNRKLVAAT